MLLELFPIWAGGKAGYLYNVTLDGDLILERSRDPAYDLARVLRSRGITGHVTLHDGKTGRPRTIIHIDKAAELMVVERSRDGLCLEIYRDSPRSDAYSPEEPQVALTIPPEANEAA
jgi:hypothetical protein